MVGDEEKSFCDIFLLKLPPRLENYVSFVSSSVKICYNIGVFTRENANEKAECSISKGDEGH